MKKILILFFVLVGIAFAADGDMISIYAQIASFSAIGVGIAIGVAACGGGIGMGIAANATILGMARNPSISSKLTTTMYISLAMIEAQVIYALVIVFILLYANPLLTETIAAAAK